MGHFIELTDLSKSFGKTEVLRSLSLSLGLGECVALIGPNGCGKTTLIKSILGMVIPTSGMVYFDGKPVGNDHQYRSEIGYMPQIGHYPENMTVEGILQMIRSVRPGQKATDEDLLKSFNLEAIGFKKMRTLSGGTTQKISAALAFLFDPKVLILDEPTAGLDPVSADVLKEKIILERKKGKLIIITSHLLNELDELITQVVYMQEGKLVFHYPAEELCRLSGETKVSRAILSVIRNQGSL